MKRAMSLPLSLTRFRRWLEGLRFPQRRITTDDGTQAFAEQALMAVPLALLLCDERDRIVAGNAAAYGLLIGDGHIIHGEAPEWASRRLTDLLSRPGVRIGGPGRSAKHWKSGTSYEYSGPDGQVFRVEATRLRRVGSGKPRWLVVLPELTAQRQTQRARESLRAVLSHDLRSPQVSILSLLKMHDGSGSVETAVLLAAIRREAERSLALTQHLLDLVAPPLEDSRVVPALVANMVLDAVDQVWARAKSARWRSKPGWMTTWIQPWLRMHRSSRGPSSICSTMPWRKVQAAGKSAFASPAKPRTHRSSLPFAMVGRACRRSIWTGCAPRCRPRARATMQTSPWL